MKVVQSQESLTLADQTSAPNLSCGEPMFVIIPVSEIGAINVIYIVPCIDIY